MNNETSKATESAQNRLQPASNGADEMPYSHSLRHHVDPHSHLSAATKAYIPFMTTPKYNKFNTGKTKNYFPINKWRCGSSNHPIIKSPEKCASSTPRAAFSQQEIQMLIGLTNTLQCSERDAVRVALYEASRSACKAHKTAFIYASSESKEKGHQGRS